jgi:hypothetical protein
MVGLGGGQGGVHVHYVLHLPAEAFDAAIERVKSHGVDVFVWDHSGPWEVSEHMREYERGESSGTL